MYIMLYNYFWYIISITYGVIYSFKIFLEPKGDTTFSREMFAFC